MTEFKLIDYLAEIIMYILFRYILFCSWESCAVYSYLLWFMPLHIIRDDHFSVDFWKSTVQSNLRLFAGLTKPFRNHDLYPLERFRMIQNLIEYAVLYSECSTVLITLTWTCCAIIFMFTVFRHLKECFLAVFKVLRYIQRDIHPVLR